jgi:CubicO group peptidase (beta-lactamase class C family)
MKKILFLFIYLTSLVALTHAQGVNRGLFIKDSLDLYINRALTNWRIPGAAVCVIKDDKIVVLRGYGIKELGLNDKVNENTLFMIGSNTKAFTATAIAMLQTDNRLSLDDKVTKYLPQFKLENKAAGEQATIRDLLCHRIGFETFQGDFTFYNTNLSPDQVIQKMALVKAAYPFRTKWGYTNSAYTVAGEIIPWAAGKTWEDYIKENIFDPLGMNNTLALSRNMASAANRTVAHSLVDGRLTATPYARLDAMPAAGGICSSASDMGKWVMALLNNGKVDNKQVIPAAAIQATRQQQDVVGNVHRLNGETDEERYGLGWFLEDYAGHHLVMHDGGVNGYLSSVTLVPEEHLSIVILTNTDQNKLYEALRWEIMDAYFKMPYRDYSDLYLRTYKANEAKKQRTDKLLRDSVALNLPLGVPVDNYTGKYHNELYGEMVVTRGEGNDLEMRFEHNPKMYVHLQPLGGNRFYAVFSDPVYGKAVFPFVFQSGKITGVRVKVDDEVERNPYFFMKN